MSRKGKSRKRRKAAAARKAGPNTVETSRDTVSGLKRSRFRRVLSVTERALAIWAVVLTTWVVFSPRVYVQPASPLDPTNPTFTPFVVQNQGHLGIHDVKLSCSVRYVKYPGDILVLGLGDYTNRIANKKHVAKTIAPGEQYSELLPLADMEHKEIENADIAIVLTFRLIKWFPWRLKTLHRFVATQSKDGEWHWLPQPIRK